MPITATSTWIAANALRNKKLVYFVEIDTYGKVFTTAGGDGTRKAWIKDQGIGVISQSVDPVNGSSSLSGVTISLIDYQRQMTADFPGFLFEGRKIVLKQGFVGLDESDFITLFTGLIDTVVTNDDGITYDFNCVDCGRLNQQVIYKVGNDGLPTASEHPRTIVGNPMDILVSVLSAEVGFADHEIDTATMYAYRDTLWAGVEMAFTITSPPDAKSFIENELLKPLGGYGWTDNLGRFTVGFMQPAPTGTPLTSQFSFTPSNLSAVPVWDEADLYNTVSYRFDDSSGGGSGSGFGSETVQLSLASVERFGQQGQLVIESKGVRSGFQGYQLAALVAQSIFNRYAWRNPSLTLESDWRPVLVQIGEFVALTHPLIPNRKTGSMGVTSQLFQVIGKNPDPLNGKITWTVIDASTLQTFGNRQIAPSGSSLQATSHAFTLAGDGGTWSGSSGVTDTGGTIWIHRYGALGVSGGTIVWSGFGTGTLPSGATLQYLLARQNDTPGYEALIVADATHTSSLSMATGAGSLDVSGWDLSTLTVSLILETGGAGGGTNHPDDLLTISGLSIQVPGSVPAFTAATSGQKAQYLFVTDDAGKQSDGTQGGTFA